MAKRSVVTPLARNLSAVVVILFLLTKVTLPVIPYPSLWNPMMAKRRWPLTLTTLRAPGAMLMAALWALNAVTPQQSRCRQTPVCGTTSVNHVTKC